MEIGTNGKQQLLFVCCKRKNGNGKLPFVFCKRKTEVCFLGRQTINGNWCLLYQQMCPYMEISSHVIYRPIQWSAAWTPAAWRYSRKPRASTTTATSSLHTSEEPTSSSSEVRTPQRLPLDYSGYKKDTDTRFIYKYLPSDWINIHA